MSSLADALLLDPYTFESWIAYRSDGLKGSGTLNDPWNGAPKLGTAVQITVLENDGQEATATAPGHALTNGDVVVISRVTGGGVMHSASSTELPVRYSSGYGRLTGIPIYGSRPFLPEYTVREAIIRGNVIRNINDEVPSDHLALHIGGCGRLLIERNIIGSALPMLHGTIGSVKTFNNLRPDGQLVRSYDGSVSAPEVVIQVRADLEDAIVASFLGI
jgi:hypothetical protein